MYKFVGGDLLSCPFRPENSGKSRSRRHLIPPMTLSVPPRPPPPPAVEVGD